MSNNFWTYLLSLFLLFACQQEVYHPKPIAYARIDFPNHSYYLWDSAQCPFSFEISQFTRIQPIPAKANQECWFDIEYTALKAKIHFSYFNTKEVPLQTLIQDTRKLAMKHLVKADDVEELYISDISQNVFGIAYNFTGSTASNFQFYLTDSTQHFVRGALYFSTPPNADSLAPSEKYVEEDIMHLIHSFRWK